MNEIKELEPISIPVPRFKIGDTIYWPTTESKIVETPCPDCNGSHKWDVKTGSGIEFQVDCPRCQKMFAAPKYEIRISEPKVMEFTVRKISIEAGYGYKDRVSSDIRYETGRGHNIREDDAFQDRDAALAIAQKKAEEQNAKDASDERIIRMREINGLDIQKAVAAELYDKLQKAEIKYDRALEKIIDLKDGYVSGLYAVRTDDERLECIARHLLSEIDEQTPDEWGDC